jgi:hypothetical protein
MNNILPINASVSVKPKRKEVPLAEMPFRGKATSIQTQETIDFIQAMACDLSHLAILADSTFLAYLLNMAAEEARQLNVKPSLGWPQELWPEVGDGVNR